MKAILLIVAWVVFNPFHSSAQSDRNLFEVSINSGFSNNYQLGSGINFKFIDNFNHFRGSDFYNAHRLTLSIGSTILYNKKNGISDEFLFDQKVTSFSSVMLGTKIGEEEQNYSVELGWAEGIIDGRTSKNTFCFSVEWSFINRPKYNLNIKYQGFKGTERYYEGLISLQGTYKFAFKN